MESWGVVIVLYHPDLAHLEQIVGIIEQKTTSIVLVNNGRKIPASFKYNHYVLELDRNSGIAYAQNAGVHRLCESFPELEAVFFLDQDSTVAPDFFSLMLTAWRKIHNKYPSLAMLSPRVNRMTEGGDYSTLAVNDGRFVKRKIDFSVTPVVTGTLPISSGILVSVIAFNQVGGLNARWFIDWVDFDFDLNLLANGYLTATTSEATIVHQIGSPNRRRFFGKSIAVTNYVLFREFYTARNGIYLIRKYGHYVKGLTAYCLGQIARRYLMLLYEPKKVRRFITLTHGVLSGLISSYR
ncbi:glycosyltransferase family 2 protein [Lacticaseibacillus salsurivasis]|uniref:glycosyltransferase family 2 protein n=1 Tax=Lacticaseibacillus salsurivasis TaxID=3081441 RepID=UPI0030C67728